MFRDLKEYQEIAKIYAEKVSKPAEVESNELVENQENRRKLTQQRQQQNAGRAEKQFSVLKPKPIQGRISRSSQNMSGKPKPMPTTAEIRAKDKADGGSGMSNIPSKEGNAVIDGKKLNPDFGKKVDIKKEFPDKEPEVETKTEVKKPKMGSPDSKFIKKERGKGPGFVKRGTPTAQRAENQEKARNRAKEMAKARIAAKKAEMSEQKLAEKMNINPGSGRDTVNEPGVLKVYRNIRTVGNLIPNIGKALAGDKDAFKKMEKKEVERYKNPKGIERVATGIADKITGDKFDFDMRGKSKDKNTVKSTYEYDAYDLVLEYLLSTEQAATIEEANYVMTEMDEKTIGSIVKEVKLSLQDK